MCRRTTAEAENITGGNLIIAYLWPIAPVVFYGSNSWSYTRLGHITDRSAEELKELLGQEDVTVRLSP